MATAPDNSWQTADDLIDPTECMTTEEYLAWVASQVAA